MDAESSTPVKKGIIVPICVIVLSNFMIVPATKNKLLKPKHVR